MISLTPTFLTFEPESAYAIGISSNKVEVLSPNNSICSQFEICYFVGVQPLLEAIGFFNIDIYANKGSGSESILSFVLFRWVILLALHI